MTCRASKRETRVVVNWPDGSTEDALFVTSQGKRCVVRRDQVAIGEDENPVIEVPLAWIKFPAAHSKKITGDNP